MKGTFSQELEELRLGELDAHKELIQEGAASFFHISDPYIEILRIENAWISSYQELRTTHCKDRRNFYKNQRFSVMVRRVVSEKEHCRKLVPAIKTEIRLLQWKIIANQDALDATLREFGRLSMEIDFPFGLRNIGLPLEMFQKKSIFKDLSDEKLFLTTSLAQSKEQLKDTIKRLEASLKKISKVGKKV